MESYVIDKICDDLIIHIYKMLDFEDQVRLASTSLRMKSIFENDIWLENYSTVDVYWSVNGLIVTNQRKANKQCLSKAGFQEFLKLYAEQIQDLQLYVKIDIELGQFTNLTKLRYICDDNPTKHLHMIARYVPNLECLEFIIRFAIFWNAEAFLGMKNLKRLSILEEKNLLCIISITNRNFNYRNFYELMSKLNLEYFKTNAYLEPDKEVFETELAPTHLKELDIQCTFDPQKWGDNFSLFLKHFENLSTLTVTISEVVPQVVITQLAETCKNLEKLTIQYTTFHNIQTFTVAPKLRDLTLGRCRGLTYANLKQLLTGTSIRRFSSTKTRYKGKCEYFPLSPLIEKLEIHLIDMGKFEKVLKGNVNLKELKLHSFRKYAGNKKTVCSTVLASCINVETLHAGLIKLDVDTIVQLTNLHSLYVNCCDLTEGGWASFITTLLRHQPLTRVHLDFGESNSLHKSNITPLKGFSTHITSLDVHVDLFRLFLDFWLDLFSRNHKMKLVCSSFFPHQIDLLREMVVCEHFPKSLRSIDVFGFTINCHDLRRDPAWTELELENLTEYLDDEFRMILCRTPAAQEEN